MARKEKETSPGLLDKSKTAQELKLEGVQNLYNFLFEACNIIRGPVSQDNFKDYITPILYYKRISDVYDEETLDALQESGGDEEYASLPEQHRFVIPDGCHWQDVRERTENLGAAIVGAMRGIELANPDTLYGVLSMFSAQKWTDKKNLSDGKIRDLIEHLSTRKLGNKDRLVSPALQLMEGGRKPSALADVIGAALHFDYQEDKEACEVQETIQSEGLHKAIIKLTEIPEDSELLRLVENKAAGF
jgi:hypothetical protein